MATHSGFRAIALALVFALTACSFGSEVQPPPRSSEPITVPEGQSTFAADIDVSLATLRRALEREVPRRLWSIDQSGVECIPPQRTEVIGIALKSPPIRCDLKGTVTRGNLALSGRGRDLFVTMPIRAEVTASDIGGIIERKTATANANVTAAVRLSVTRDWGVGGTVDIRYDWTSPPTVTLLGQKITFADKADERLKTVVARLERTLQAEIARLDLRSEIAPLWQRGFTVLSLNRENPPVWLRLTPEALGYDGYSASRNAVSVRVRLAAKTEIFVGDEPDAPDAAPLPRMARNLASSSGLALTMPVVAQYSELEKVVQKALTKRAKRPFPLPRLGERMVEFRSVTAYGTSDNRVALGVEFKAWKPGERDDPASGTVWLTARPSNAPDSRTVEFLDPEYQAETSRFTTNILLEIAKTQDFSDAIEEALTQNFEKDYSDLIKKVEAALAQKQLGDFAIATKLDTVSTGTLAAYGEGLFLPVSANGVARIRFAPR
ncbi:DUF4403 family protein [Erythrobacter sp. JK5]|uniref:DUF4403 family protein n=1 Tax=Erythrobacter sp. JK5 TaxID=2829500 RepID=UPI001BA56C31|nr:DUF4403 family protein [Erythrobacter sp. JK5]QUL38414.1 DUF4403 family protein [Erythrobacter sp. JK5]